MEEEKSEYEQRLQNVNEELTQDLSKYFGKPVEKVRAELVNLLAMFQNKELTNKIMRNIVKKNALEGEIKDEQEKLKNGYDPRYELPPKITLEEIQKQTAAFYDVDKLVEEKLQKHIPAMLEDMKKMANIYYISPEEMLHRLQRRLEIKERKREWILGLYPIDYHNKLLEMLDKLEKACEPLGLTTKYFLQKLQDALSKEPIVA
ncbi:MAG: hypothetical protein WC606_05880 [Candidatus Absconditabacterales bacterium]|jgi:hypothetical protein